LRNYASSKPNHARARATIRNPPAGSPAGANPKTGVSLRGRQSMASTTSQTGVGILLSGDRPDRGICCRTFDAPAGRAVPSHDPACRPVWGTKAGCSPKVRGGLRHRNRFPLLTVSTIKHLLARAFVRAERFLCQVALRLGIKKLLPEFCPVSLRHRLCPWKKPRMPKLDPGVVW